jgi:transposase
VNRPVWSPNDDAHLIYHWVKLEGKSQSWVAAAFRVSQSTVSRILQRYERWQAHAQAREGGRLDHHERLRAQRWLTYERNERILTSCLRIAHEIEGFIDTSRSTIRHEAHQPSKELEVRTQHTRIDRTGMVARFLRLAYRINMDQLKLAEQAEPPPPPPLTDEELAQEELQAAADAAELAAGRVGSAHHDAAVDPDEAASLADTSPPPSSTEYSLPSTPTAPNAAVAPAPTLNPEPGTWNDPLHNLHNQNPPEIAATAALPCICASNSGVEKNSATCITDPTPLPSWSLEPETLNSPTHQSLTHHSPASHAPCPQRT